MLKDLQSLFKQTWQAFRTELGRREPEDEVAELLAMMRREMVEARAALPGYADAIRAIDAEISREQRALADCERRAGLAERIGDGETRRVADDFATRHRERLAVLEQKRAAAEAERDLRTRETQQMAQRYKEAEADRFTLLAALRRQRAASNLRDAMHGETGPFRDFARMEEAVRDDLARAEAAEELAGDGPAPSARERAQRVDDRLEELKRKLRKS